MLPDLPHPVLIDLDSLRFLTLPLRAKRELKHSSSRPFSSTSHPSLEKRKGQHYNARDQYLRQQAKQRREANLSRQAVLQEERAKATGNPIRGVTTPFLESLDRAQPAQAQTPPDSGSRETPAKRSDIMRRLSSDLVSPDRHQEPPHPPPARTPDEERLRSRKPPLFPTHTVQQHFNHLFTNTDLEKSLDFSQKLLEPVVKRERTWVDPMRDLTQREEHRIRDEAAREAISRITSLSNASSREKTLTNVQRIIHQFGRHNTDAVLKPKAPANLSQPNKITQQALPRAGPDTGSSEVQIGILTAKIRVLADRYQGENRNDKINKRNLLLLLHRRQKLLRYMHKKERGSGRWQNLIETLGLTEATWKGEISI